MDRLWTPWRYAYVSRQDAHGAEADTPMPRQGVPPALVAWFDEHPEGLGCVFCNMLASVQFAVDRGLPGEQADHAAWILHRAEHNFVVLNAFPYNSGHLMVVPYQHLDSLAGLPEPAALEMMQLARRIETALRSVYSPDGLNLGMNMGESAGAGVAHHLHLHAVPRWTGDNNFMGVIGETRILPEMLENTWERVRAALTSSSPAA